MASRAALTRLAPLLRQTARPSAASVPNRSVAIFPQAASTTSSTAQTQLRLSPSATTVRFAHSIPKPQSARAAEGKTAQQLRLETSPHYRLDFTCIPCDTRSRHNVSKQGYHHGSVLITCPQCRNRHIISDHLGIFGDKKVTVEDLMREKGRLVKRGTLGEDGDIEFYAEEEGGESKAQDAEGKPKGSS